MIGSRIGFGAAAGVAALMLGPLALGKRPALPSLSDDEPRKGRAFGIREVLRGCFQQPGVRVVVPVLLNHRPGGGFPGMKMPFFLNPIKPGGLRIVATATPDGGFCLGDRVGGDEMRWRCRPVPTAQQRPRSAQRNARASLRISGVRKRWAQGARVQARRRAASKVRPAPSSAREPGSGTRLCASVA